MKIQRRVWENKSNKQKLVTIPFYSDINAGDLVWIEKVQQKGGEIMKKIAEGKIIKIQQEGISLQGTIKYLTRENKGWKKIGEEKIDQNKIFKICQKRHLLPRLSYQVWIRKGKATKGIDIEDADYLGKHIILVNELLEDKEKHNLWEIEEIKEADKK